MCVYNIELLSTSEGVAQVIKKGKTVAGVVFTLRQDFLQRKCPCCKQLALSYESIVQDVEVVDGHVPNMKELRRQIVSLMPAEPLCGCLETSDTLVYHMKNEELPMERWERAMMEMRMVKQQTV